MHSWGCSEGPGHRQPLLCSLPMLLVCWQYGFVFMPAGLTAGQFGVAEDSSQPAVLQSSFNSSRQGHYRFAALASLTCFADQLIHRVWPSAQQGAATAGKRVLCEALNKICFPFFVCVWKELCADLST